MAENKYHAQEWFKNNLPIKIPNQKWQLAEIKIAKSIEEIKKNIQKIGSIEDARELHSKSLIEIYNESYTYWAEHKTFKKMPHKKLKSLLQILFPSPNNGVEKGLYDNPEQFDDFLNTLIQKNKQSLLKKLISELLCYYPKKNRILLFDRLNKAYNALDKHKNSNKLLVQANERFKLLEAEGPELIAKEILNTNKNLSDILQAIYIKEKHFLRGIGANIVDWICHLIASHIEREDEQTLDRFLEYLSGDKNTQTASQTESSFTENGDLKRYNNISSVASTLLIPFKNRQPKKSFKNKITQFLDQHIGDPRFQSEKWLAMKKEKDIFLKWKIGETLFDFFALLDYTAKENPNADRMWPYRKEFIESYWNKGHIQSAWIILGKQAYEHRFQFLKEGFNEYGQITKGVDLFHSVLLFKIGNLTLSEWNHTGKVRIWNEGNKYEPNFYKKEYSRKNLIKNPDKEIIHSNAKGYYWQKQLSSYIEGYTGILCPPSLQKKLDQFY